LKQWWGYYALLQRLNNTPYRQRASFLPAHADGLWQLIAIDTGLHDYNPFWVTDVVTFVNPEEEVWHRQRLREFSATTILLSHHQLFSAYSQIGEAATNRTALSHPDAA
jgi:hypothetical protein